MKSRFILNSDRRCSAIGHPTPSPKRSILHVNVENKCNFLTRNGTEHSLFLKSDQIGRIHLTTGQFGSKHSQAFRRGFVRALVFTAWICLMNTNSLMKHVRNA